MASFGTLSSTGEPLPAPTAESPFRIGMLADFSGRKNRGIKGSSEDIAARKLVRVSRDTLDEVMAKIGVQLELPVGEGGTASLSFASLDDFHPDQVHERVEQIADAFDSEEKSALMNSVLHNADFQALESAWRGLDWLLSRAVKGSQVEVLLLDVSRAELAADLKVDDLTASGLYQVLIEKGVRGPRGEPWAVLVGNYTFNFTVPHAELLGRIAKIAGQTSAPFLATVDPAILDASFKMPAEAAPAWKALRQLPEAALLGLAMPRFLLRLPYGENTQSIDKFSYEEISVPPDRSHYLWGNPAVACGVLLAQAFHKQGWGCKPGQMLELDKLPIHVFTMDDDEQVTLAEAWLARPQIELLVKQGIMTFLCVKGKGAIQLLRFQSLAQPAKDQPFCELQGRWSPGGAAAASRAPSLGPKVGVVAQSPPPPAKSVPVAAAAPPPVSAPAARAAPPAPVASAPAASAAPEEAAQVEEAPPAEEEMDPDLAAMLKELEGG
jgi:type VI secretion system protein ImpC